MPKLPTRQDFGPRETPRSPRKVRSFKAGLAETAAAKGFRELAKSSASFASIGKDIVAASRKSEEEERQARLADADARWQVARIELHDKYRQDQDHATLTQRFAKDLDQVRDGIAGGLDPESGEVFARRAMVDGARSIASMDRQATAYRNDAIRGWLRS